MANERPPTMVDRMKRSLVASTSASMLISIPTVIAPHRQHSVSQQRGGGRSRQSNERGSIAALATSAVAFLQSMPLAYGQQLTEVTLEVRAESSAKANDVHIARNLPILLVIIAGSIILFTMFVTALACLFRSSSSRTGESKSARGSFAEGGVGGVIGARNRDSWCPGGPNSIFTYSGESLGLHNDSTDDLSMSKEGKNRKSGGGSALSPVSPMPALKDQEQYEDEKLQLPCAFYSLPGVNKHNKVLRAVNVPPPVAMCPRVRGNGWQLYDNPVPHSILDGGDVEAAGLGPTRRPSFIDRLLAHRADPNDARLPNGQLADNSTLAPRIPSSRKVSGSAILSALNPLRSRDNSQKRLTIVDSDFEGSIGGRDGELPMAKRKAGRFAFDEATVAAFSPAAHRQSIDRFSPLPPRCVSGRHQRQGSTPRNMPGLAGVGATWNSKEENLSQDNHGRVPTFAELQRIAVSSPDAHRWKMQTTIDAWVQGSRCAGRPPPSRRGSSASFLTVGGASCQSVARRQSVDSGLDRVPSIRPHFAATTTLASWLDKDAQVIDEQSEGEEGAKVETADGINGGYVVCGDHESADALGGQERRDMKRPPSYQSDVVPLPSSSSIDGTMGHVQNIEALEEPEKRRQRHIAKEKRRAEKRASRHHHHQQQHHHSRQTEEVGARRGSSAIEQQQDFVLIMDERREQHHHILDADEIVAQSRRSSTKIINIPSNSRSASRMMSPMSPPESPLTSASEGPCRTPRRRSEHFLVPSSRSRSSVNSGSMRSVSHSVLVSQRQSQSNDLTISGGTLATKQSLGQITLTSVSERPLY